MVCIGSMYCTILEKTSFEIFPNLYKIAPILSSGSLVSEKTKNPSLKMMHFSIPSCEKQIRPFFFLKWISLKKLLMCSIVFLLLYKDVPFCNDLFSDGAPHMLVRIDS